MVLRCYFTTRVSPTSYAVISIDKHNKLLYYKESNFVWCLVFHMRSLIITCSSNYFDTESRGKPPNTPISALTTIFLVLPICRMEGVATRGVTVVERETFVTVNS